MALVQLNWKPSAKELRSFGAIFLVGFVIIGLVKYFSPFEWLISRNQNVGLTFIIIGVVVGAIGLTGTKLALPLYWIWLSIAFVMGNIVSRVIIAVIYYLVVTPVGWLAWLVGRDKLQLKKKKNQQTYWVKTSLPKEPRKYERQF
jgi:hypothetical protein